jgi:hypothetical protein
LVPRRPLSAFEVTDNKKRSNQTAAAKKRGDDAGEPSPPPPEDMDERLIFDAHRLANQYVNEMVCFSFSRLLILTFFCSLLTNKLMLKSIQRQMQQSQAVLLHLVVLVEKMLKVVVKMQKAIKKVQVEKVPQVEKVLQEKVEKKERRKEMKHRWKVRIIT